MGSLLDLQSPVSGGARGFERRPNFLDYLPYFTASFLARFRTARTGSYRSEAVLWRHRTGRSIAASQDDLEQSPEQTFRNRLPVNGASLQMVTFDMCGDCQLPRLPPCELWRQRVVPKIAFGQSGGRYEHQSIV